MPLVEALALAAFGALGILFMIGGLVWVLSKQA